MPKIYYNQEVVDYMWLCVSLYGVPAEFGLEGISNYIQISRFFFSDFVWSLSAAG